MRGDGRLRQLVLAMLVLPVAGCVMPPTAGAPGSLPPLAKALRDCSTSETDIARQLAALRQPACEPTREAGRSLACIARTLPKVPDASLRHGAAGLLEFEHCLGPLADALAAGRWPGSDPAARTWRICVAQLESRAAAPVAPAPWWQRARQALRDLVSDPDPAPVTPVRLAGLPIELPANEAPSAGKCWPAWQPRSAGWAPQADDRVTTPLAPSTDKPVPDRLAPVPDRLPSDLRRF